VISSGFPPNEVRGVFEVDDRQTVRDGMGVDHTPFQNGLVLAYNIRNTLLYNDRIMIKVYQTHRSNEKSKVNTLKFFSLLSSCTKHDMLYACVLVFDIILKRTKYYV
jgi:hypothetical protein